MKNIVWIFYIPLGYSRAGAIEVFWVSGHPLPVHLSNCTVYSRLRLIRTHWTPNIVPINRSSQLKVVVHYNNRPLVHP